MNQAYVLGAASCESRPYRNPWTRKLNKNARRRHPRPASLSISTVSAASGLRASGGALGVGRAVQRAVMVSIILIIVLGYAITWLFYFLLRE